MNRVLVVDDDKEVVRLMKAYLEKSGFHVFTSYNGEDALHIIRRERPDLILLDLMLPDRDGWEIIRLIRKDPMLSTMPVIVITARVTDEDKILGLTLGADDYVTKPYNPREVVARVNARLRIERNAGGGRVLRILEVGRLRLDPGRRDVKVNGRPVELTATEFDLLQALMEESGFVLTRQSLIQRALGSEFSGVERTLDSHIRNLRRKLEAGDEDNNYISAVYGVGYKLDVETVDE